MTNIIGEATVRATIELDAGSAKKAVDEAGKEMGDSVDRSTKSISTNLGSVGRSLARTGTALTLGVTVPLVAAGTSVIKFASDFEREMIRVQIATGATGDDLATLNDLARELGASTVFSAAEAAEGMSALGRAGFSTQEILESIRGTLALAATEQMDLGRASEITAAALRGMGLQADQAGRVADVLAQGANDSLASVEGLGNALGYTAGQARLQGLSLEQTVGFLSALSDAGVDASRSGTALNQMLRNLSAPTKKLGTQLQRFGVHVRDGSGQMRDMEDIFRDVSKLGPDAMNAIARAMDANASRAFLELAQRAGQTDNNLSDLINRLEGSEGAAKRMGDALTGGTAGALEQLSSAVEGLSISIAQSGLLEVFTGIVRGITDMVDALSGANPAILQVITILGLLAAAIGPVLVAVGAVVSAIGTIGGAIAALGGAAVVGPVAAAILGVVAALAALGLAFKAAYDSSKGFRDVIAAIGTQMLAFGQGFVDSFLAGIQPLVDVFNTQVGPALSDFGAQLDQVLQAAAPLMEQMAPVAEKVGQVFGQVFGSGLIAPIMGLITVLKAVAFVAQQTAVVMVQVVRGVQDAWGSLVGAVTGAWDAVVTAVQTGVAAVIGFLTGSGQAVSEAGTTAWDGFVQGVQGALQGLLDWVMGVWNAFWSTQFGQVLANALGLVVDMFNLTAAVNQLVLNTILAIGAVIVQGLQDQWASISGFFEDLWASVIGTTTAWAKTMLTFFGTFFATMANTISAWARSVGKFFSDLWNSILAVTTGWARSIIAVVSGPLRTIGNAISSALSIWKKYFSDAWASIVSGLKAAWDTIGVAIAGAWIHLNARLTELKNQIIGFWSGAGTWLLGAGRAVIQGFLDGLNSMISQIRAVLQSITAMIPENKGPKSRDKVLLVENGQLIMQSLLSGIDRGVPELQRKLRGITAMVPRTVGSSPTTTAPGTAAPAVAGSVVNMNFYGPSTSGGRRRELDWMMRYGTKGFATTAPGMAS